MAQYVISVDFTMSKHIMVEAESEEQAKSILNGWIKYNPYEYAYSFDAYVNHEITNIDKEEEEKSELDKALDYVRKNMDEDGMAILHAEMNKCYKMHLIPDDDVMDCSQVIDLLEEYGEEHDLPEGWWESECEISDILVKL